jgi:hypothetical protein
VEGGIPNADIRVFKNEIKAHIRLLKEQGDLDLDIDSDSLFHR